MGIKDGMNAIDAHCDMTLGSSSLGDKIDTY